MATKVHVNRQFAIQWRDVVRSWWFAAGFPLVDLAWALLSSWENDTPFTFAWKATVVSVVKASAIFVVAKIFDKPKVITEYENNEQAASVAEDIKIQNQ